MVSDAKLYNSFPSGQYYSIADRLDRNSPGGRKFHLYSRRYIIKTNSNTLFN